MSHERKFRVLVVDDEAPARARIRSFLAAEKDFELVGECARGGEAVEAIRREKPDLVFLDVQMPRMDGFGVCEAVGAEAMPLVVFATAFDQHAVRAFEVHALDYLLKPFDRTRFQKALDRARRQLQGRDPASHRDELRAVLAEWRASAPPDHLLLKVDGRLLLLQPSEVDWVEAEGNYVRFHVGAQAHLARETLTECESRLPAGHFVRISRSVVVNARRIREVEPLFHGDAAVLLRDGKRLTLTRNYRESFEAFLHRAPPAAQA